MNRIVLLLTMLMLVTATLLSQRDMLWMRGTGQTSLSWTPTTLHLSNIENYQFNNLIFLDVYPLSLNNGVVETANLLAGSYEGHDDILGIAHDYGGLVLRQLQLQEPKISAMILDGVPNHGSVALEYSTSFSTGTLSPARRMVNRLERYLEQDDCNNCDVVGEFKSWLQELDNGSLYLKDAIVGSQVITNLDNSPPTVPFAIMWGSVNNFSLTKMLSSLSSPSDGDDFTRCYLESLERERLLANENFHVINNATGFFTSVLTFIGGLAEGSSGSPSPSAVIGATANFIEDTRTRTLEEIRLVRKRDKELARILRCEFSNQLMAVEWQIALTGSTFETITIQVPSSFADCEAQCNQEGWEDNYMNVCIWSCQNSETKSIQVVVPQANDGLFSRSEQQLAGAAKTYHLPETNHFQETRIGQAPVVAALNDLFQGGAGAAFIVPQ